MAGIVKGNYIGHLFGGYYKTEAHEKLNDTQESDPLFWNI